MKPATLPARRNTSRTTGRNRRVSPRAGFTLVELLVGATLSAMLMAAVLSTYIFLGRNLARLANQQTLETEARRTLDYFTADIRMARELYGTPTSTSVAVILPTPTGFNIITYYYNNTSSAASVSVNGTAVSMAANTLTRCVYNGSSVSSLVLLRNITSSGLSVKYYDAAGRSYSSYTAYRAGIKQLALQFSTQTGVAANGTQTPVYQVASGRMALRNKSFLQ